MSRMVWLNGSIELFLLWPAPWEKKPVFLLPCGWNPLPQLLTSKIDFLIHTSTPAKLLINYSMERSPRFNTSSPLDKYATPISPKKNGPPAANSQPGQSSVTSLATPPNTFIAFTIQPTV